MSPASTGLWLTLAAAALFAVGAVVAASTFDTVGPVGVAQTRAVITALVLGVLAYRRRMVASRRDLGSLALLGVLLASVTILFYVAIDRLGVGPGSTIQFTGPVIVLVWSRFVDKHRFPLGAWLAAFAAVVGIGLITQVWAGDLDPLGILAAIGSAFTFAAYLVLAARLGRSLPTLTVVSYSFAFSALIWVLVAPIEWASYDAPTWARLAFIGVAGTTFPFVLEMAALRRTNPALVGVVATAEPVISTALAWLFLNQVLAPAQVAGAGLTILAIVAVHLVASRPGVASIRTGASRPEAD